MKQILLKIQKYFQNQVQFAVLDLEKGRWEVEFNLRNIPYLKAENARGRHILIRPAPSIEDDFLMADDLSFYQVKSHHLSNKNRLRNGRMIIETSPGNFQVWIRSSRKLSNQEKKGWLEILKSDPSASPNGRFGRCPGFRNRKEKYNVNGLYPLAKLIWVDWSTVARIPQIPENHLILDPISPLPPKGGVCQKQITRADYNRGNPSITDFCYTLSLLRRGFDEELIWDRLINERDDWGNHQGENRRNQYIRRTIEKAKQRL